MGAGHYRRRFLNTRSAWRQRPLRSIPSGNNVTLAGALHPVARSSRFSAGTLTLTGANTYGGTVVAAGVLQGNSTQPARQHHQLRLRGIQPDGIRYLCWRDVGPRQHDVAGRQRGP